MRSPRLVLALGLIALALPAHSTSPPRRSGLDLPDWSRSTLECPDWRLMLPAKALFVEASEGTTFDTEWRHVVGQTPVAPGGEAQVRIVLIAGPESDGTRLTVGASIAGNESFYVSRTTEVEARRRAGETTALGPVAVTSAGLWVLGFLATGPIFIGGCALLGGARPGVLGLALAAWVASGFLLVFVAMAREDSRLLNDYREAACVVTDTGLHTRTSGQGRHATNISEPFVAVRFEVAGTTTFGTGFDSGSHLRVGGSTTSCGRRAAGCRAAARPRARSSGTRRPRSRTFPRSPRSGRCPWRGRRRSCGSSGRRGSG